MDFLFQEEPQTIFKFTNTLQANSTFYVTSGTVNGPFNVPGIQIGLIDMQIGHSGSGVASQIWFGNSGFPYIAEQNAVGLGWGSNGTATQVFLSSYNSVGINTQFPTHSLDISNTGGGDIGFARAVYLGATPGSAGSSGRIP